MNRFLTYILLGIMLLCISCSSDEENVQEQSVMSISSTIESFEGEPSTRANVAGNAFATGDLIKIKIICPFTNSTQNGESTWGNTYDSFWLLKWNGDAWVKLESNDHFDIHGDYSYSSSTDIFGIYESQATPYVHTATTWTEERLFRDKSQNLVGQYCSVFHHDQSREKNYLASDVLWAQQYSQTGTFNIHLSFNHVMACLLFTIDDNGLSQKISSDAVLTVEGMPNIDQQEIVVGDYYAYKSKSNSRYGYRQKSSCAYENNGKVLGIASIDESAGHAVVHPFTGGITDIGGLGTSYIGNYVENNGTYICHNVGNKQYRLIVPPCVLNSEAVLWLRDDTRRFSVKLERTSFEQGHLYKINMKVSDPVIAPEGDTEPKDSSSSLDTNNSNM